MGAAEQAKQVLVERGMAPENMVVIDSLTGCAGHGFMAVAAANALERGEDLAGAVTAARAMRENVKIIVMVDTLEYLRRGGRIGAARAWIGATLKVKPILTIEGEMQPVERVRTASRAFERLVAHLEQRHENGCDGFAIQHVQARAEAERLAEKGREIYGRDPELISEIGPVIGTHTGPGILGVTGPQHRVARPLLKDSAAAAGTHPRWASRSIHARTAANLRSSRSSRPTRRGSSSARCSSRSCSRSRST